MGTNEGWPEAFGFSISGDTPVVISEVEDGGSAQQAGLQPGDAIIELDGVCVEQWNRMQVMDRARSSDKVPPSLVVMSRVRQFTIPRDSDGGFGITFRGNSPVFVRSVDYPSPARSAGVRSGDLLLEINWENVRFFSKSEVLERIKRTVGVLHLMVVAGGLGSTPRSSIYSEMSGGVASERGMRGDQRTLDARTQKARVFHSKVNYYLMNDELKKSHLLTLLRLYSKDRDINSLGHSLDLLLDTPIQRRLLPHIRAFILSSHHKRFDVLVSYTPEQASSSRRGSCDLGSPTRSFSSLARMSPWRSSLPNLAAGGERVVRVDRGASGFGFTLSGNCPVFIRSLDAGGAASRAGLLPGDRILKLNGLDVRNSTHSHVVRLLRGSGTRPTLVVSSASRSVSMATEVRRNSQAFREKMDTVLVSGEKAAVVEQLGQFSRDRNLKDLVQRLGAVLNDDKKAVLFHYICQLLPEETQNEFDRIAAAMLDGGDSSSGDQQPQLPMIGAMQYEARSHDTPSISHDQAQTAGAVNTNVRSEVNMGSELEGGVRDETKFTIASAKGPSSIEDAIKLRAGATLPDISMASTIGEIPLPQNPPPTPHSGLGGVPAPPPLPGTQVAKLKRVNWEKVHGTAGTIWSELSGLEDALEYCEIEQQFSSQKPKQSTAAQKMKKPSILDSRKAYNISILLGHLKLPFEKIKEAILACDESVLSEQHLRQLEAFAPDKQECLGFTRYRGNPELLSIPDRFSLEMSTIPSYHERLKAMVFKLHFKDKVAEIKPDLEAISLAAIQLQSSKHLKKVLEIVLAVGNYMNAGNQRVGGATGFRIAYLAQLKDLRTTDNKSTLLHFVAGTAERKFPSTLDFPNDLSYIRNAARVSGETLEVEVNELTQGLKSIRSDINDMAPMEIDPNDRFLNIMNEFLVEADQAMDTLLKLYVKMKQEFQAAVKFFGEDPGKMRVDDFFVTFATFVDDFERACRENKEEREKQVLMERRLQEQAQQSRKTGSFKLFGRSKEKEIDLRKELEAKSARKPINIAAIEGRGSRGVAEQHDFRHVLRQTDHSEQRDGQAGVVSGPKPRPQQFSGSDSRDYDYETQF